jgi:hypothetical protein
MPISTKTANAKVHYVKVELDRAFRDVEPGSDESELIVKALQGLNAIKALFDAIAVDEKPGKPVKTAKPAKPAKRGKKVEEEFEEVEE